VRPYKAQETAEAVERLNHRREERRVAAVSRKDLPDCDLQAADHLFGLLAFLIGHIGSPLGSQLSVLSFQFQLQVVYKLRVCG
jgi:hypothetical protein